MTTIRIDATDFQAADQGDTTVFGGLVVVTCGDKTEEVQCRSTDRDSWNCFDEIFAAVSRVANLTQIQQDALSEEGVSDDANCAITGQKVFDVVIQDDRVTIQEVSSPEITEEKADELAERLLNCADTHELARILLELPASKMVHEERTERWSGILHPLIDIQVGTHAF